MSSILCAAAGTIAWGEQHHVLPSLQDKEKALVCPAVPWQPVLHWVERVAVHQDMAVLCRANAQYAFAMSMQALRILWISVNTVCVLQNKLARVVIDRVPCLEMVRFVNSGTEACLSVLRLMRAFTGRNKVLPHVCDCSKTTKIKSLFKTASWLALEMIQADNAASLLCCDICAVSNVIKINEATAS